MRRDDGGLSRDLFTVEFWVHLREIWDPECTFLQRTADNALDYDWALKWDAPEQRLIFQTANNSFSTAVHPDIGEWCHVALVVNKNASTALVYVNGNRIGSGGYFPAQYSAPTTLRWGSTNKSGRGQLKSAYFGAIRYWNLERSQAQINVAMSNHLPPTDRIGLSGLWKFCGFPDGNSNGPFPDSSGLGHHLFGSATITGNVASEALFAKLACVPTPVPLRIVRSGPVELCEGDSVTLTAEGPYSSFLWSTGETRKSIVVKNEGRFGGIYHVKGVTSENCIDADSVSVRFQKRPVPRIIGVLQVNLCDEERSSYFTTLNPGNRYEWTLEGGAGSIDSGVGTHGVGIQWTKPGVGILTVRESTSFGCANLSSIVINVYHTVFLRMTVRGRETLCKGDSVELDAGDDYATYRWNTGDTTRSIVVTKAGEYTLTVSDVNGCTGTSTRRIYDTPDPVLNASGPTTFCQGDSVTLFLTREYVSYKWSTGAVRSSTTVKTGGVYSVEVVDTNGCRGVASVAVTTSPRPTASISGPQDACAPIIGTYSISIIAPSGYTWTVEGGMGTILDGNGSPIVRVRWDSSGTARLRVRVRASNGCLLDTSIAVRVRTASQVAVAAQGPIRFCEGDSVLLEAAIGFISYTWSNGRTGRTITVTQGGAYSVTAIDSNGCSSTSGSVIVQVDAKPVARIVGPNRVCEKMVSSFSMNDTTQAVLRWTVEGGTIASDTSAATISIRWDSARVAYVRLVCSRGSCTAETTITVTVTPQPQPRITSTNGYRICRGDSTVLGTELRYASYEWKDSNTVIIGRASALSVQNSGRYTVSVHDTNGCEGDFTVSIDVSPAPSPMIVGPHALCAGDSVQLILNNNFARVEWRDGTGQVLSKDSVIVARSAGVYSVAVLDSNGCSGISPIHTLQLYPVPSPVVAGPDSLCPGDTAVLHINGRYVNIEWRDAQGTLLGSDSVLHVSSSGVYRVSVRDTNGCRGISPPHALVFHPLPPVPVISRRWDTLFVTAAHAYQWYYEDSALAGENGYSCIARRDGRYSVRVTNALGCSLGSPSFIFTKYRASATMGLPFIEAAPGDTVNIAVSLLVSENLMEAGAESYSGSIRFNKTLLAPIHGTGEGRIEGGDRVLSFSSTFNRYGGPLHTFSLLATLGNAERTSLQFDTFEWNGVPVDVTTVDGGFSLKICREGGDRLFAGKGQLQLFQNRPNPFNAECVIEYEVIENALTNLSIYDLLGRRISTLVHAIVQPGRFSVRFDASHLASGLYPAVLHSGASTRMIMLSLKK